MNINDTSKDTLIDDATAKIEAKRLYLMQNWSWMTESERKDRKEQLKMMEDNREHLVAAKAGKTVKRIKSLYDPIPQTEDEKRKLLELIDSV